MDQVSLRTIRETVSEIKSRAIDYEVAHSLEDDLHRSVLEWIALNSSDATGKAFAKEALKSIEIEFGRWCA